MLLYTSKIYLSKDYMDEVLKDGPPIEELNSPFRYHALQAAIIHRDADKAQEIANPLHTKVPEDLADLFEQGKKIELRVEGNAYSISTIDEYQAFMTATVEQLQKLQSAIPEPEEPAASATSSPLDALKKSEDNELGMKEKIDALIASIENGDYTINSLKYDVMAVSNEAHSNKTITDNETRQKSIQDLGTLSTLVEATNKSLGETYAERCKAVVGELMQWAKDAQQASGITEQSNNNDTWRSLEYFIGREQELISRADPYHLHAALETLLYKAKQFKNESGKDGIDGEKLLRILEESHSKPAEVAEEITTPTKTSRGLLGKLFGRK